MQPKTRTDWIQALCESSLRTVEIMKPPTEEQLSHKLSLMSNGEVYGLYKFGSKKGKRLAKIECLNRGLIKESIFNRLFKRFK